MDRRTVEIFVRIQRENRALMVQRFIRTHGRRTVGFAMRHLDQLVTEHPGGLADLPRVCRVLRERRDESRSWNLAAEIYIELLKNLAEHLEKLEARNARKQKVGPTITPDSRRPKVEARAAR